MLIAPSSTWRGTDGRGMTVEQFAEHVRDIKLGDFVPQFVALHNTASPNKAQWQSSTPIPQRLRNLSSYYSGMGWHGGPHMFIDDKLIWLFTPLDRPGVHSPSWNSIAWGIEMVGDYDSEPFDSGFGLAVRDNAVAAAAILLKKIGKPCNSQTLRFHYEDARTTHACPGKHVKKLEVLKEITARMAGPVLVAPKPAKKRKRYRVLMTEFGGTGDRQESAYGGMVNPDAFEAAIPCKVPAAQRSIAIYRSGGKSVIARVNDLGPHNKTDDYWNDEGGRPACEDQRANRQPAENGIVPRNVAGLDATRAVFDELGIPGKEGTRQATVEWEFVHPPIEADAGDATAAEGEHPIPPPKPPPLTAPTPWWARLLQGKGHS
jgi:N-acetylmuramoyl-L-alanine amidase